MNVTTEYHLLNQSSIYPVTSTFSKAQLLLQNDNLEPKREPPYDLSIPGLTYPTKSAITSLTSRPIDLIPQLQKLPPLQLSTSSNFSFSNSIPKGPKKWRNAQSNEVSSKGMKVRTCDYKEKKQNDRLGFKNIQEVVIVEDSENSEEDLEEGEIKVSKSTRDEMTRKGKEEAERVTRKRENLPQRSKFSRLPLPANPYKNTLLSRIKPKEKGQGRKSLKPQRAQPLRPYEASVPVPPPYRSPERIVDLNQFRDVLLSHNHSAPVLEQPAVTSPNLAQLQGLLPLFTTYTSPPIPASVPFPTSFPRFTSLPPPPVQLISSPDRFETISYSLSAPVIQPKVEIETIIIDNESDDEDPYVVLARSRLPKRATARTQTSLSNETILPSLPSRPSPPILFTPLSLQKEQVRDTRLSFSSDTSCSAASQPWTHDMFEEAIMKPNPLRPPVTNLLYPLPQKPIQTHPIPVFSSQSSISFTPIKISTDELSLREKVKASIALRKTNRENLAQENNILAPTPIKPLPFGDDNILSLERECYNESLIMKRKSSGSSSSSSRLFESGLSGGSIIEWEDSDSEEGEEEVDDINSSLKRRRIESENREDSPSILPFDSPPSTLTFVLHFDNPPPSFSLFESSINSSSSSSFPALISPRGFPPAPSIPEKKIANESQDQKIDEITGCDSISSTSLPEESKDHSEIWLSSVLDSFGKDKDEKET